MSADQNATFNAFDWYWDLQDGRVFSSRRIAILPPDDPEYLAFLKGGGLHTPCPKDADGDDSFDELQTQVLDAWNLHATPQHLVGALRYDQAEALLVPVTIGTKTYPFQGDTASRNAIAQATLLAERYEAQAGAGTYRTPWKTASGFVDPLLTLDDLVTVGLAIGSAVQACFARESAVVSQIEAGTLTTPAEVRAAYAAAA